MYYYRNMKDICYFTSPCNTIRRSLQNTIPALMVIEVLHNTCIKKTLVMFAFMRCCACRSANDIKVSLEQSCLYFWIIFAVLCCHRSLCPAIKKKRTHLILSQKTHTKYLLVQYKVFVSTDSWKLRHSTLHFGKIPPCYT